MQLIHDYIACGLQETYSAGQAVFSSSDNINTTHSFLTEAKPFSSSVYVYCYELFWYAYPWPEVKKTGQFTPALIPQKLLLFKITNWIDRPTLCSTLHCQILPYRVFYYLEFFSFMASYGLKQTYCLFYLTLQSPSTPYTLF